MLRNPKNFGSPSNINQLKYTLAYLLKTKRSIQGFSLLESLVAIAVVGVVVSVFTPPIFLAVGTRIQNRRAEQAMQLAQAEVDRVRRLVEQGGYEESSAAYSPNSLPPIGGGDVRQQPRPSNYTDSLNGVNANTALRIDANGDGTYDFLVQVFRDQGVVRRNRSGVNTTYAFNMGVRVYSAVATQNIGLLESPPQRVASLKLASALGEQKRRPLAIMYTTVVRSDVQHSLGDYHQFAGGGRPSWAPLPP